MNNNLNQNYQGNNLNQNNTNYSNSNFNNYNNYNNKYNKQRASKSKVFFQLILVIFVGILIGYLLLANIKTKHGDTLLSRWTTYFQFFTGSLDKTIPNEDNTILEEKKSSTVKIEEGKGKIEVKPGSDKAIVPKEKTEADNFANPDSDSANSHYYNQLDKYGKIIYTKLKKESAYFLDGQHTFDFGYGFNDLLNAPNGDKTLKRAFQYSINALIFDYPELFFIDLEKISLSIQKTEYNNDTAVYKVFISNIEGQSFYIKGINSKAELEQKRTQVYSERNKVLTAISNMKTEDKIKYIHDYIVDRTTYDKTISGDNIYNIMGPMLEKSAVCEGYAKTFKFLMDGAKIPTILVAGKGYDNYGKVERHAWNYVQLDGYWYLVDTTWDDPIIIGGVLTNDLKYKYFLVGSDITSKSHVADGNIVDDSSFRYPRLSQYGR